MSQPLAGPRISISDAFDGGNIDLVEMVGPSASVNDDDSFITVKLKIKKDPYTELEKQHHFQYFAFRATVSNTNNSAVEAHFVIENAGETSFPQAWKGSTVCYSSNLSGDDDWQRNLQTAYTAGGSLTWKHTFDTTASSVYFAYFPPFSYERHLNLVAKCAQSPLATVSSLGQTLDGREIDLIQIGTGSTTVWIIHRQHPGESQAEYYAEGLLTRLLGLQTNEEIDGNVRQALERFTIYIVPCMCPDGAVRGYLRTNACGANLNREWNTVQDDYKAPSLERSPEVYHVLHKMDESPPDIFLDVHGDEELPVNFLAGSQGTPNWEKSQRLQRLHGAFLAAYVRANSDMQQPIGYTPADPNKVVINTATKVIATRFDCLASTLEMPFKDCATNPDASHGWSPHRCRMLGASVVEPLLYIQPYLKAEGAFWEKFSKQDAYVRPQHRQFAYGANNEVLDL